MIERLFDMALLFMAFQTPYPWLVVIGVAISVLVYSGIFFKICNGFFGYMLFVLSLAALVLSFLWIGDCEFPEEDGNLDGKTVAVRYVNAHGLRLDTGDWVIPAGVEYFEGRGTWRYNRMAISETRRVINNSNVLMEWDDSMNGYKIFTADRTDLGLHLVSMGLARTNGSSNDELTTAELKAKAEHVGAWVKIRKGFEYKISPVGIAGIVYSTAIVVVGIAAVLLTLIDRSLEYLIVEKDFF